MNPGFNSSSSSIENEPPRTESRDYGPYALTVLTTEQPCTKQFSVDLFGQINKTTSATIVKADYERREVADLDELRALLQGLTPHQVLVYGVPKNAPPSGRLYSRNEQEQHPDTPSITRTQDDLAFPAGPGFLMLDYDPPTGDTGLDREALIHQVFTHLLPEAQGCGYLWWSSASSCIFHGDQQYSGIKGQRILIPVTDAQEIPRMTNVLMVRSWTRGDNLGRIEVSKAGTPLVRGLVDCSVFQPERLDFIGGAWVGPGLEQRRGTPVVVEGPALDLSTVKDPSDARIADAERAQQARKESPEVASALAEAREAWLKSRTRDLANTHGVSYQSARDTLTEALDTQALWGDFILTLNTGEQVTVRQVLQNPTQYHNQECRDPLDPDYRSDDRIAVLKLLQGPARLFSHAHGGATYRLHPQARRVYIQPGEMYQVVDETLKVLTQEPDMFEHGVGLNQDVVQVVKGKMLPLDETLLTRRSEQALCYMKSVTHNRERRWIRTDAPPRIGREILSSKGQRGFRTLNSIETIPLMLADGRILSQSGYDEQSGLLLDLPKRVTIPEEPNRDQIRAAFDILWQTYATFPLENAESRGIVLAAVLTAVCRAGFVAAPGFLIDGNENAAGKTALAESLCILRAGDVSTTAEIRNPEELNKTLLTKARVNAPYLLIDNVAMSLNSTVLAALMTSGRFNGRLLGGNDEGDYLWPAFITMTGVNLNTSAELARRLLVARILSNEPQMKARRIPMTAQQYVTRYRQEMAVAACTILRAAQQQGAKAPNNLGIASYEAWDQIIRSAVCWLAENPGLSGGVELGDPIAGIEQRREMDPMRITWGGLLDALRNYYGKGHFTTNELITLFEAGQRGPAPYGGPLAAKAEAERDLVDALRDAAPMNGSCINAKLFGRLLAKNKDTQVGGLRIEDSGQRIHNKTLWTVADITGERSPHPVWADVSRETVVPLRTTHPIPTGCVVRVHGSAQRNIALELNFAQYDDPANLLKWCREHAGDEDPVAFLRGLGRNDRADWLAKHTAA